MEKFSFNTPIWKVMTEKVYTIRPSTSVKEIRQIFQTNTFHHLPVVDRSGSLIGLVSCQDLSKVNNLQNCQQLNDTQLMAKDIMSSFPITVSVHDELGIALDLFTENLYHALPVVDGDMLVGIITTHDILSLVLSEVVVDNEKATA